MSSRGREEEGESNRWKERKRGSPVETLRLMTFRYDLALILRKSVANFGKEAHLQMAFAS